MSHTLYVDPTIGKHRYQLCIGVDESEVVQAEARACCVLDNGGSQVSAQEDGENGVAFAIADADVAVLQGLVDAELNGKEMTGKGDLEFWIRGSKIEKGKGTGPWFHYRETVAASGLAPEKQENRIPVLPAATIPYDAIEAAAVSAVEAAIA